MACHLLRFDYATEVFKRRKVKDMVLPRTRHSVCSDGRYLFASGTAADFYKKESKAIRKKKKRVDPRTVEIYDPMGDFWELMPDLNVGRSNHSSCCLNDSLYIFCGCDAN